jgi:hypothetical protein
MSLPATLSSPDNNLSIEISGINEMQRRAAKSLPAVSERQLNRTTELLWLHC